MAWTRETKASRLLARFADAAVQRAVEEEKVRAEQWPTEALVQQKIAAERRFNMLRGTLFRTIMKSTEEL